MLRNKQAPFKAGSLAVAGGCYTDEVESSIC